ncbi:MAG TPA: xanthine dehydrogenase family protein subunit M [Acidimicrobiia bacterium]|nr:xanthine dehydrogenase family protein subunit M [Acidimicrobiia bacterium]
MKPAAFDYHAPESVDDVLGLLREHGDEAKVIAGGQSLIPMLSMRLTRFEHLVDMNGVAELRGIDRSNGDLVVGAMTRQSEAEHAPETAAVPLLQRALPFIAHFQIRNRGTVGGSLAHADPASELPAVALALDARFDVAGTGGVREVTAPELFVGTWTTSLRDDEVLRAVRFPVWEGRCGFAVDEVARRSGDFALAGVACAIEVDGADVVRRAAIAFFGMAPTPVRASSAEQALVGTSPDGADFEELGRLAAQGCSPTADVHASAEYRMHLGAQLARRAIGRALGEARGV